MLSPQDALDHQRKMDSISHQMEYWHLPDATREHTREYFEYLWYQTPYIVMAYIGMAYVGMAYIVVVYIGMAYIVMAYIVIASIGAGSS